MPSVGQQKSAIFSLKDGALTTPFELAHQTKPDLRVLFQLFALVAVHHE
jgi:hypothetical protein